jgi:CheY-like chemotaxis protein
MLADLGYAVVEAADGVEGLKLLRSLPHIDLLVTDVGLPNGMNGRQLADAGREITADLKVLFITGFAETAAVHNGLVETGMQVMTKPFSMVSFAKKVRSMVESTA